MIDKKEDYNNAAHIYSKNRVAVGIEIILGSCVIQGLNISGSTLVDMGCGSGNYSVALSPFFKNIYGYDVSTGQLDSASKNILEKKIKNVKFQKSDIRNLPLEDNSVEVVLISLVLHHIRDDKEGCHFREQEKVLQESNRILKPNGVLIISTCSPIQIEKGAWYCEILPSRVIELRKSYYPSIQKLKSSLNNIGFTFIGKFIETDKRLHGDGYVDYRKFLNPKLRKVDSIFSSLNDKETKEFESTVLTLHSESRLQALIDNNEKNLNIIGQTSFLVFKKDS